MKLQARSLGGRLMAFFEANPDEELTVRQICTKFEAPLGTVENALAKLSMQRAIEHVRVVRLPAKGRNRGDSHDSKEAADLTIAP